VRTRLPGKAQGLPGAASVFRPARQDQRRNTEGSSNKRAPNASLSQPGNAATGNGGGCYGDSGGANFLGTSDVLAAITITGDAVCRATNVVYRLDTESARAFLADYL